jgi:hypothetical protein
MVIKDINNAEKYIRRELGLLKKSHTEVGIRDGQLNEEGFDIARYAIANEFGEGHIPARPFFRSTLEEQKKKYAEYLTESIDDILDLTASNHIVALSRIGHLVVNDIKDKIASNIQPENAPATKKAKGGSENAKTTTLIDTGAMINAVNYKVARS